MIKTKKQDSLHVILWNIMQEIPIMLSMLTKRFSLPNSKHTPIKEGY